MYCRLVKEWNTFDNSPESLFCTISKYSVQCRRLSAAFQIHHRKEKLETYVDSLAAPFHVEWFRWSYSMTTGVALYKISMVRTYHTGVIRLHTQNSNCAADNSPNAVTSKIQEGMLPRNLLLIRLRSTAKQRKTDNVSFFVLRYGPATNFWWAITKRSKVAQFIRYARDKVEIERQCICRRRSKTASETSILSKAPQATSK